MKFWRENKETLINFAEFVYNNKNFTYDYIKKRFKFDKSNDNEMLIEIVIENMREIIWIKVLFLKTCFKLIFYTFHTSTYHKIYSLFYE